jgi:hypothetical protein
MSVAALGRGVAHALSDGLDHGGKGTVGRLEQLQRRALLDEPPLAEDEDGVVVDDRVQPVRDREERRGLKLGAQQRLDGGV